MTATLPIATASSIAHHHRPTMSLTVFLLMPTLRANEPIGKPVGMHAEPEGHNWTWPPPILEARHGFWPFATPHFPRPLTFARRNLSASAQDIAPPFSLLEPSSLLNSG